MKITKEEAIKIIRSKAEDYKRKMKERGVHETTLHYYDGKFEGLRLALQYIENTV